MTLVPDKNSRYNQSIQVQENLTVQCNASSMFQGLVPPPFLDQLSVSRISCMVLSTPHPVRALLRLVAPVLLSCVAIPADGMRVSVVTGSNKGTQQSRDEADTALVL